MNIHGANSIASFTSAARRTRSRRSPSPGARRRISPRSRGGRKRRPALHRPLGAGPDAFGGSRISPSPGRGRRASDAHARGDRRGRERERRVLGDGARARRVDAGAAADGSARAARRREDSAGSGSGMNRDPAKVDPPAVRAVHGGLRELERVGGGVPAGRISWGPSGRRRHPRRRRRGASSAIAT